MIRFWLNYLKQFRNAILPVFAFVVLAGPGLAQAVPETLDDLIGPLIVPVTEGSGPMEKIIRFEAAPGAHDRRLANADVRALGEAFVNKNAQARERAEIALAAQALGDTQGTFAAVGTLAEHALFATPFSGVNTALNDLGLMLAVAQMARDVSKGDDAAAFYGGLKASMNYAVGRWGWGPLQIGGVAMFVVEITLREWQAGLTEIGVDVWKCRYQSYYREHPRSVSEWKAQIWNLYLEAENQASKPFGIYLDGILNEYVYRAFDSADLSLYSECGSSSFGDRQYIRDIIADEHKAVLEEMLAERVLPEIAERAWRRDLKRQILTANERLRPRLNAEFELAVTAYDVEPSARIVMPLPAGGEWAGNLRADGTFRTRLTYFAVMKAGFPETVKLVTETGSEERRLSLSGKRLTAMFGAPRTPLVARYRVEEGDRACAVRRIAADGSVSDETVTLNARPPSMIDVTHLANGTQIMGRFDMQSGWKPASPGMVEGNRVVFGAPHVDDIHALRNCRFGFLANDSTAAGKCTIERFETMQVSARAEIERKCVSTATFTLVGAFATLAEDMQYFDLGGPEGEALADVLKKSLAKGVKDFDPSSLVTPPLNSQQSQ